MILNLFINTESSTADKLTRRMSQNRAVNVACHNLVSFEEIQP